MKICLKYSNDKYGLVVDAGPLGEMALHDFTLPAIKRSGVKMVTIEREMVWAHPRLCGIKYGRIGIETMLMTLLYLGYEIDMRSGK